MNIPKLLILISGIWIVSSSSCRYQAADRSLQSQQIKKVENSLLPESYPEDQAIPFMRLEDRMKFYKVPGVSIAFIDNNEIAWQVTYGVTDSLSKRPVTVNTLFQAASLSKPLTAFVTLVETEERDINLDSGIDSLITSWQIPESQYATDSITIRSILSHHAGFNLPSCPGYLEKPVPNTLQILNGSKPAVNDPVHLIAEPNRTFNYSAGGYTIIQLWLEELYNKSFIHILDGYFSELDLRYSTFDSDQIGKKWTDVALGHDEDGATVEHNWAYYPEYAAAGLWSTPSDYAKFLIEMYRSLNGEGMLGDSLANEMIKEQNWIFGLGWMVQDYKDVALRCDGGHYGYNAISFMYKNKKQGVVIMTNGHNRELLVEIMRSISYVYEWHHFKPELVK